MFWVYSEGFVLIGVVKRLITINRIQNKSFCYIIYVLCIFIMYTGASQ